LRSMASMFISSSPLVYKGPYSRIVFIAGMH
jgi:hypothetical protein